MPRLRQSLSPLIRDLCRAKGWSVKQLAIKAGVKTDTARKVWNGKGVLLSSIEAVAEALDVDYRTLLIPSDPEAIAHDTSPATKKNWIAVTIRFEGDPQALMDAGVFTLVSQMEAMIASRDNIEPIAFRFGSLIVHIQISKRDVYSLVNNMYNGRCHDKGLSAMSIDKASFFAATHFGPLWLGAISITNSVAFRILKHLSLNSLTIYFLLTVRSAVDVWSIFLHIVGLSVSVGFELPSLVRYIRNKKRYKVMMSQDDRAIFLSYDLAETRFDAIKDSLRPDPLLDVRG
jgi:transcriptional regulator with XRE-family HTH domain